MTQENNIHVNILRKIIGTETCAELRTKQLNEKFEFGDYTEKTLLLGSDVLSDFLLCSSAGTIKKLTGGDLVEAEIKYLTKKAQLEDVFNMIITSNKRLLVNVDDDLDAWKRRMLVIKYAGAPPTEFIPDFDEILLKEEGPGILNFLVQGAAKVLCEGFPESSLAYKRAGDILLESNSIYGFLETCIELTDSGDGITIDELRNRYREWCVQKHLTPMTDDNGKHRLKDAIESRFGVNEAHSLKRTDSSGNETEARGYRGVKFKEPDDQ